MSTIHMRFDGGGSYGFGNIRRSHALGLYLQSRGHVVSFQPLSEQARALFSGEVAEAGGKADAVVLDLPYEGDAEVQRAHAAGGKVLALDYDGAVLAPDVAIGLQATRRVPAGCRSLCGPEFSIMRAEIMARPPITAGNEVLIIVGGGDSDGLSEKIVRALLPHELRLCVVQGPAGTALDLQLAGVRTVTHPPNLVALMAGCAWAVTTGGTTMLEMLCLGKAAHVVPRTEQELWFAEHFARQSALLGIGLETLGLPAAADLRRCESLGPQLVDGRGCERIAMELESLLK